jgi:hypothetical protein
MSKSSQAFKIGRNARTGELTTVDKARRYPDTHVVEHMPKRGRGDVKK